MGPVDQHSQLQLFRDGPGRSLYTILSTDTQEMTHKIALRMAALAKLDGHIDPAC